MSTVRNPVKATCLFHRSGFTLIEILTALTILSGLVLLLYGTVQTAIPSLLNLRISYIEKTDTEFVLDQIVDMLCYTYVETGNPVTTFRHQTPSPINSLPTIQFTSLLPADYTKLHEVELKVHPTQDGFQELRLRIDQTPDGDPSSGGVTYVLLNQIIEIRFRFFKQGSWYLQWDFTDSGQLPELVEITVRRSANGIIAIQRIVHLAIGI